MSNDYKTVDKVIKCILSQAQLNTSSLRLSIGLILKKALTLTGTEIVKMFQTQRTKEVVEQKLKDEEGLGLFIKLPTLIIQILSAPEQ